MTNLFREAKRLLDTKEGSEMNEEELLIINTAIIPLNLLPEFNDKTIDEGLEELAKIVEEAPWKQPIVDIRQPVSRSW